MDRIDITDAVDQIIKPSWNIERPVYITPARPSKDKPSKKSHAKKKAPGHISRPMNKFMLFRHNFDDQKVIPPGVARNHTVISDYAGKVWHYLTPEQKEPWGKLADEVRIEHHIAHPNYKLPGTSPKKKGKRRGKAAVAVAKPPRIAPLPKIMPPAVVESPQGPAPADLVDTAVEHLPQPEPLGVKEEVADATLSLPMPPEQRFSWHGCKGELKEGDDPSWLLHDPPCDDALEDLSEPQYFHPPQCDTFSGDAINQINFDPVLCSWGGIRRSPDYPIDYALPGGLTIEFDTETQSFVEGLAQLPSQSCGQVYEYMPFDHSQNLEMLCDSSTEYFNFDEQNIHFLTPLPSS